MKVSVITVCFNSESTIARCMQSIRNQSYLDIEHVVVDGASTDQTTHIVKQYLLDQSQFVSEPDQGIYDAMNKGLKRATGDIICFLNADDCYHDVQIISEVVDKFKASSLDILITDVVYFKASNPDKIVRRYRSNQFLKYGFAMGYQPAHPGLFLSKRVVDETGLFDPGYRIAGDLDYEIRVFADQRWHYEYVPMVTVKMQSGGVSTGGLRSKIILNAEMLRACKKNGIKTNLFKILSKYPLKLMGMIHRS
jgi:glycosyltransferase involved in cell wall biosynthesis